MERYVSKRKFGILILEVDHEREVVSDISIWIDSTGASTDKTVNGLFGAVAKIDGISPIPEGFNPYEFANEGGKYSTHYYEQVSRLSLSNVTGSRFVRADDHFKDRVRMLSDDKIIATVR